MEYIKYTSGYKYQLAEDYRCFVGFHPRDEIETEFLSLSTTGVLRIRRGYAWDGPSGPSIDTKTFMRGSLVHDALYQLIRHRYLPMVYRVKADNCMKAICLQDGMIGVRAWWCHLAVRTFGAKAASPTNIKELMTAPKEKRKC